jgi:ligand-binding sensor domain-containing protein
MWIFTGDKVGYFDENNWIFFSEKDFGFPDSPFDMAVAPDGTVWLASRQAISHYLDAHWIVYYIPDAPEWSIPRLAIDSSNKVWLSLSLCGCDNSLRLFDGTNWDEQQRQGDTDQLLFNRDGTLWAPIDRAIGHYNGKKWIKYSGFWISPKTESGHFNIRIASDNQGNIFGIADLQHWISKGRISNIPFDFLHYEFNSYLMRLFIDKKGRIWTNACPKDNEQSCLAYYQDNQWISFRNLPFHTMIDMKELSDGTLLVATDQGLFQYKPEN